VVFGVWITLDRPGRCALLELLQLLELLELLELLTRLSRVPSPSAADLEDGSGDVGSFG